VQSFFCLAQFILALLLTLRLVAQSAFSIYWDMQLATPAHSSLHVTASEFKQGVNFGTTVLLTSNSSSIQSYSGASGENNAALACRTGPLNRTPTGSSYFSFSVSAIAGYKFVLQTIALGLRSTSSGPQSWALYSSADNFTTPIQSGNVPNNSNWVFQQYSITAGYHTSLEYRIYGYDGVGTAAINVANWRIDDLQLTGMVTPATLPVHWLYTTLKAFNSRVLVEWATAWEINNARYHVERSADGHTFLKIGEVAAGPISNQNVKQVYQFLDATPLEGRGFYRIVQEDRDGVLNYGMVRSIVRVADTSFSLLSFRYENAAQQVSILCKGVGHTTLQVYTMTGQFLSQTQRYLAPGEPRSIRIPIGIKNTAPVILLVLQNNHRAAYQIITYN